MRVKIFSLIIFLIFLMAGSVCAESRVSVTVRTVLVSQGPAYIDPKLSDLINELKSVFRYSSYRLLGRNDLVIDMGKTGTAQLPGERELQITPQNVSGNRITLRLALLKKNRQVFQTVIQILKGGSITVGGPEYEGGNLLFNISAS